MKGREKGRGKEGMGEIVSWLCVKTYFVLWQKQCHPHSHRARVEHHLLSRRAVNFLKRDDTLEELPWNCTVISSHCILLLKSVVVLFTVVSELFLEASRSVSDDDPHL